MATKMSLKLREAKAGWFFLHVPSALFGTRARVRVRGTMNGHPFSDATAAPGAEDEHVIAVNETMRESFGIARGDTVNVEIEIDDAPRRKVEAPRKPAGRTKTPTRKKRVTKQAKKKRATKAPKKSTKKKTTKKR